MHSLQVNNKARPVDVSAKEPSEKESDRENALIGESSMIVNVSKSKGEVSESRGCEVAQTGRTTPRADDCEFDPDLDKQLENAAEELMRELHEECDRREGIRCERKESAKADSDGLAGSEEDRIEEIESEQVDNSNIAGMRVDNRYYLSVVLGGRA